jgi:hypothetical protein
VKVDLTPAQLRLVAAAVRYVLELDPDGDGYETGSREEKTLKAALERLNAPERDNAARLRRRLDAAEKHIKTLAGDVQAGVDADAGLPGEDPHPTLARHQRDVDAARRFLAKLEAAEK